MKRGVAAPGPLPLFDSAAVPDDVPHAVIVNGALAWSAEGGYTDARPGVIATGG